MHAEGGWAKLPVAGQRWPIGHAQHGGRIAVTEHSGSKARPQLSRSPSWCGLWWVLVVEWRFGGGGNRVEDALKFVVSDSERVRSTFFSGRWSFFYICERGLRPRSQSFRLSALALAGESMVAGRWVHDGGIGKN